MIKKYREEKRQEVIEARKDGATIAQIAVMTGVGQTTIKIWLKDAGCQVIVASLHCGAEYNATHGNIHDRYGKILKNLGAHIIIGNHRTDVMVALRHIGKTEQAVQTRHLVGINLNGRYKLYKCQYQLVV